MLADDHSGAISGGNCTKMHIAQRKRSSIYHGRCFIVMIYEGGGLTKTGTLVMVFVVLRC